jgi:hypothetical protein
MKASDDCDSGADLEAIYPDALSDVLYLRQMLEELHLIRW